MCMGWGSRMVVCISECGCYIIDVWASMIVMLSVVQVFEDGCILVMVYTSLG